ncbi:MAG: L,D-transpeptidase family protein [Xanthomonadales bacterium]|nr:L,D-transpeptidase family protein [Xanthomonadales bacterium]
MLIIIGLLVQCSTAWAAPELDSEISAVQLQIEQLLNISDAEVAGDTIYLQDLLREVYAANAYAPLWTSIERLDELRTLLLDSSSHGLQPRDYHLRAIDVLVQQTRIAPSPANRAALDVLLTDSLMLYGHHRSLGKVKAQDLDPNINFRREALKSYPSVEAVRHAVIFENLAAFIESIAPTYDYYEILRVQLRRYRQLQEQGGWPNVPAGPTLHQGDRGGRVALLRQRLLIEGELFTPEITDTEFFDSQLEQAVRSFQVLYGLDSDGVAGKKTIAAMNVPVLTRINQLRLSLERLRWVSQEVNDEFIAVNIAGFRLSYVRNQKVVWTTRIMVGQPYRKTPIFRGDITYIEFNPTWTIPPTILRNDTLPAIKKDPGYLAAKNIAVLDASGRRLNPDDIDWNSFGNSIPYTLRQDPGPKNALGRMKFIFPNAHFVFMHDTPNQAPFNLPERAFSSGCIRVENAFELAELVLQDFSDFTPMQMQAVLDSGRTQRVVLSKPTPVLILYLTAALDSSGKAKFYRDVYGRDPAELMALDGLVKIDLPGSD